MNNTEIINLLDKMVTADIQKAAGQSTMVAEMYRAKAKGRVETVLTLGLIDGNDAVTFCEYIDLIIDG